MPEHSTLFAYQAHLAGTDYIAIPRQVGAETRVEIHLLHNPGVDHVTGAIVAEDGNLLEVSRLVVSRSGHEHSRIIDPGTLSEPARDAFRRLAAACSRLTPLRFLTRRSPSLASKATLVALIGALTRMVRS
jgi:hypothetical protein